MEPSVDLPKQAEQAVAQFIDAAKRAFDSDLVSIVLYGSGAEGKLRPTSDVNMLVVLRQFDAARAELLREPMRVSHAMAKLSAMFVLENEVQAAADAFTVKFADMVVRHRVLYGSDPFSRVTISREATLRRLRQVLLNYELRLRERFVAVGLREEQLEKLIADAAGPLRSSAASLLRIEGRQVASAKAALKEIVAETNDPVLIQVLQDISDARENVTRPPGRAPQTVIALMRLTQALRERVERIPANP